MSAIKENTGGGFPAPMPADVTGGGKVRILVIDNESADLDGIRKALTAGHREITTLKASDAATAVKAFDNHHIVIVDQDLKGDWGTEGLEVIAEIKRTRAETIVILNSAMPAFPRDDPLEPDYVHMKGVGTTLRRGEHKSLLPPGTTPCSWYENLAKLVSQIEQEKIGIRQ